MKANQKLTLLPLMFMVSLFSLMTTTSLAGETVLMVSIDKAGTKASEIKQAVANLNQKDPNTGTCFVDSTVTDYIDYSKFAPEATYFGVAIVQFKWKCDQYARKFLDRLNANKRYSIWSNPAIGPLPAVSGSNRKRE